MKQVKRIIYVAGSGTSRAPMAAAVTKSMLKGSDVDVLSRGIVVQFPEPLNQKAEAILISNGLEEKDYRAKQIADREITEDTIIFTMEESQRVKVIGELEHATEENTFVLSTFVGDELEILDTYGAPLQSYGLCFEVIKRSVEKALERLYPEKKGE